MMITFVTDIQTVRNLGHPAVNIHKEDNEFIGHETISIIHNVVTSRWNNAYTAEVWRILTRISYSNDLRYSSRYLCGRVYTTSGRAKGVSQDSI